MRRTVHHPRRLDPLFEEVEGEVERFFCPGPGDGPRLDDGPVPDDGPVSGQYALLRLASASRGFVEHYRQQYPALPPDQSGAEARDLLADLGHGLGAADARAFCARHEARGPAQRLAAGLLHLSRIGWAGIEVLPESALDAGAASLLVLDLTGSLEVEAWTAPGAAAPRPVQPVCVMIGGYLSGWAGIALGAPIAATEILCRGKGDDHCRFITCAVDRSMDQIVAHLERHPDHARFVTRYSVPRFFAERGRRQQETFDEVVREAKERTADLMLANKILQAEVAERKLAESALRESDARYRQLFNSVNDGVLIFEIEGGRPRGGLVEVNDVLCQQLGQDRTELLARDPRALIAPAVRDEFDRVLARLTDEQHVLFDSLLMGQSGQKVPVEVHAHVFELSGRTVALLTSRDVTDRRRAAAEQAQLSDQLRHAQKMEAIGQLSGGIAHDFNNLLTAIMSDAALLLHDVADGDPLREPIEEIMDATERAARLTKRLLVFSRRQVLKPERLDLNRLVTGLEARLRRLIGGQVELHLALGAGLGGVMVDPPQVEQIVIHLVTNACDAMPDGGKLVIETRDVELDEDYARGHLAVKPGPYVLLAVSDTGVGMDAETLCRIFDPFFSRTSAPDRAGLGLAITYGFVKQSNGNIWAYSEPGHGTTIKIYLPRLEEAEQREAVVRPQRSLQRGSETILLVEDEDLIRSVAGRILRKRGFHILEAANGPEAIELCQQSNRKIDLLITDIMMPRMNGRELARLLRELRPGMRVLYMSGFTSDVLVQQELLDQGMAFLEKPFTPTILLKKVQEVLDRPA